MTPAELENARAALGLTQGEIGKALGVTDRAVRYWLAGVKPIPRMAEALIRLALTTAGVRRELGIASAKIGGPIVSPQHPRAGHPPRHPPEGPA